MKRLFRANRKHIVNPRLIDGESVLQRRVAGTERQEKIEGAAAKPQKFKEMMNL